MPGCGRTGGGVLQQPCRNERMPSTLSMVSSRIDTGTVWGPAAPDERHWLATGWAGGHKRRRGFDARHLRNDGLYRRDHPPQGIALDRAAGMVAATMSDLLEARGQAMREDAAEKRAHLEASGPRASASGCAGGQSDGAVHARDAAAVREGDPEDRGGTGTEGGAAAWLRLRVDVPGDRPDARGDLLKQPRLAPDVFEHRAVDGREGLDGAKEVGSGGAPGGAVVGASAARDHIVEVGMGRKLVAPGMEDTGKAGQVRANKALVFGKTFQRLSRSIAEGLGGALGMCAAKGSQGFRDGEGEEQVRHWELLFQLRVQPRLGCMGLAWGTGAIATGMVDAGWPPTALAPVETVAIVPTAAVLHGADGPVV
jgi:hypothetical protein